MADPAFWDEPQKAQKTISQVNLLKEWVFPFREIKRRFYDIKDIYPEALEVGDKVFLEELDKDFLSMQEALEALEVRKMFSNELDAKNCYLSINAGAGGTESCDWAEMLLRMYQKWALKKGWAFEEIDKLEGEVAGVKNATFKVSGAFAYGHCKAEKGVHRLVRISPFDSNAKRHTSFASIEVVPEIDEDVVVEIRPEDLKIDTYRSSGAGGQHVNTTDSAVRMTHLPTGLVSTCQKERSQLQNKETCLKMLKAKVYERQLEERKGELAKISGEKKEIAWGSQIRNYVFHPYTLVKDARTKVETSDVLSVMDGAIDPFIIAYLKEFG